MGLGEGEEGLPTCMKNTSPLKGSQDQSDTQLPNLYLQFITMNGKEVNILYFPKLRDLNSAGDQDVKPVPENEQEHSFIK